MVNCITQPSMIEDSDNKKVNKETNVAKMPPSKTNHDFNIFIYICFFIFIVRDIITIITEVPYLLMDETVEAGGHVYQVTDHVNDLTNIVRTIGIITSLVLVLMKKKIGVYAFFLIQVFTFIYICDNGGDPAYNFGAMLVPCIGFALPLFLRKNGASGWKILFPTKYVS